LHSRDVIPSLVDGISDHVDTMAPLGFSGLVVGLSGGVDSAVACALARQGRWPVHALVVEMDVNEGFSPETVRSLELARRLDVPHTCVNASQVYAEHLRMIPGGSTLARVHLRSRVVTTVVLHLADSQSFLAVDTTDRSEIVLRMYEESFRGHVAPLAGLYKSEVYEMADAFGLSDLRGPRSGCPELVDFDAYGLEWEELDSILIRVVEQGAPLSSIERDYGLPHEWVMKLQRRIDLQPMRTSTQVVTPGR
jgi:NAD+ synthase